MPSQILTLQETWNIFMFQSDWIQRVGLWAECTDFSAFYWKGSWNSSSADGFLQELEHLFMRGWHEGLSQVRIDCFPSHHPAPRWFKALVQQHSCLPSIGTPMHDSAQEKGLTMDCSTCMEVLETKFQCSTYSCIGHVGPCRKECHWQLAICKLKVASPQFPRSIGENKTSLPEYGIGVGFSSVSCRSAGRPGLTEKRVGVTPAVPLPLQCVNPPSAKHVRRDERGPSQRRCALIHSGSASISDDVRISQVLSKFSLR